MIVKKTIRKIDVQLSKVFVITLARSHNRWPIIYKNILDVGINDQILYKVLGVDGLNYKKQEKYKDFQKSDVYKQFVNSKHSYTEGQLGCYQSWKRLLEYIKDFDERHPILILEDDSILQINFCILLNQLLNEYKKENIDWDIIFLGQSFGFHNKYNGKIDYIKGCHICTTQGSKKASHDDFLGGMVGTGSLLLNPKKLKKINSQIPDQMTFPIDTLFGKLNQQNKLKIFVYCNGNLVDYNQDSSLTKNIHGIKYIGSNLKSKSKKRFKQQIQLESKQTS